MNLQPGYRFVVAPLFELPADWPVRLMVGAGVDETDGRFFARDSWRPPTPDELRLLVRTPDGATPPEDLEACICLFRLPAHLRSEWWNVLARASGSLGEGHLPGFESFVSRVGEFLDFKGLPAREGARCDVVVSNPGQRFVHWAPDPSRPGAMRGKPAPGAGRRSAEEQRWPRLWGGINLGDEETSVVLINLPCRQLDAMLRRRYPDQPPPATVGDRSGHFLRSCSDYPPVRLMLGPGEGCRLPQGGLILGGCLRGKQDPDVLLLISDEDPGGPGC
jgi:hypothetical protein